MVIVGRVSTLCQLFDGVFETEQHPRVYLQGEVEVERAVAGLLGVQVDLPGLVERVGFDEVPLVVDMEPVVNGMVFQLGDIPGHIDDGHCHKATRNAATGNVRLVATAVAEACDKPALGTTTGRTFLEAALVGP